MRTSSETKNGDNLTTCAQPQHFSEPQCVYYFASMPRVPDVTYNFIRGGRSRHHRIDIAACLLFVVLNQLDLPFRYDLAS